MLITGALIFASVFLLGLGLRFVWHEQSQRRIRRRLQEIALTEEVHVAPAIVRDLKLSSIPALDRVLRHLQFVDDLEVLLVQADVSLSVGSFLLLVLALAAAGVFVGLQVLSRAWLAAPLGVALGVVPFVVIHVKKVKRIRMFERQLPDALDLITGALRAGMAFTSALQLVAEECPDPIAKEFMIVCEEHRLGLDLQEALVKMTRRVDTPELQYFVAAVVLQRETGGNLSEVLEGAAEIIRDRFRILGDVRTITAQARLSGGILVVLPLVMAAMLTILVPDYFDIMKTDPIGRYMIFGSLGLQIIGFLAIRRIIDIKV